MRLSNMWQGLPSLLKRTSARTNSCRDTKFRQGAVKLSSVVLLAALGAAAAQTQAAGRVFYDNFESGNANQWSSDGSRSRCVVVGKGVDGGSPHSGSDQLECNWNGAVSWDATNAYSTLMLPQSSWKYGSEYLIRFWLRYDADVDKVNGGKVFRLYPGNNLDSFYIGAQMNVAGGPAFIYWELINGTPGPEFWGGTTTLGDTKWHKIEIYVKAAVGGAVKVWYDGSLVQQGTNLSTNGAWGPMYLMSNWSNNPGWEHDANNHVYWDDIEIYSDSGSGASGTLADASISSGSTSTSGGTATASVVPDPPGNVSVQ